MNHHFFVQRLFLRMSYANKLIYIYRFREVCVGTSWNMLINYIIKTLGFVQ